MSNDLRLPTYEECSKPVFVAKTSQPATLKDHIDKLISSEGRATPVSPSVTRFSESQMEDFASSIWSKGALFVYWPGLLPSRVCFVGLFATSIDVSPKALAAEPLRGVYFRQCRLSQEAFRKWEYEALEKEGLLSEQTHFIPNDQVEHLEMESRSWFDRIVGLILPAAAKKYEEEKSAEAEASAEKWIKTE